MNKDRVLKFSIDIKIPGSYTDKDLLFLYNTMVHSIASIKGVEVMDDGQAPYTEDMSEYYKKELEKPEVETRLALAVYGGAILRLECTRTKDNPSPGEDSYTCRYQNVNLNEEGWSDNLIDVINKIKLSYDLSRDIVTEFGTLIEKIQIHIFSLYNQLFNYGQKVFKLDDDRWSRML